jgi:hypothetical protein
MQAVRVALRLWLKVHGTARKLVGLGFATHQQRTPWATNGSTHPYPKP